MALAAGGFVVLRRLTTLASVTSRTPSGATAYSLRLSEKIRAIAYRDGDS